MRYPRPPSAGRLTSCIVTGLNWYWISLMATAPPVVALLVALPFWRSRQMTLGSIAGTVMIFGTAMGLILREYVELDRITKACLDAGTVCWPEPSAFTRFAIYASIGLIEVFLLFIVNLKVEERLRRRGYAKEWQR
jgi:hypothetical protein